MSSWNLDRYTNVNTVNELFLCPSFVKPRPDNSSTVVVEVASFVGNPVPRQAPPLGCEIYARKVACQLSKVKAFD